MVLDFTGQNRDVINVICIVVLCFSLFVWHTKRTFFCGQVVEVNKYVLDQCSTLEEFLKTNAPKMDPRSVPITRQSLQLLVF